MTKIREEIESWFDYLLAEDVFDMDLRRETAANEIEYVCRSWALEEREKVLDDLISAVGEKLVDYKPKPNVSYLAIKWDDLFEIVKGLEKQ